MNRWLMARWIKEAIRSARFSPARRDGNRSAIVTLQPDQLEDRCMPIVGSLADATVVTRGPDAASGAGYDGVVQIGPFPGGLHATGSLVYTGRHILTAAHIADGASAKEVTFQMKRGTEGYDILIDVPAGKDYQVPHTRYTSYTEGYDISVLKLTDPELVSPNRYLVAPYGANKFDLYAAGDELTPSPKTFTMVGYGAGGKGETGARPNDSTDPKRKGENTFDVDSNVYRNEIQSIEVRNAVDGTFTLSFGVVKTAAIAWNASASDIQTALEAATDDSDETIPTPLNGHVRVRGGASANNIFFVEFMDSAPPVTYAGKDVSEISADGKGLVGASDVLGGPLLATVTVITRVTGNLNGVSADGISLGLDFDRAGNTAQDALGLYYGKAHPGLGDARETYAALGDSGSPALIDGRIAGVYSGYSGEASRKTPDYDGEPRNFGWGEREWYTRVSPFVGAGKFLTDTLEPAGAYDLVLDMKYQVVGALSTTGAGTPGENVTITADQSGGNLELWVQVQGEAKNLYYSSAANKIQSLTIRGSDDNETFNIVGDLGISGNVYIDGRTGKDEVIYDDSAPIGDDRHYTIGPAPAVPAGWELQLNRWAVVGLPGVDSKNIAKYTLITGSGADLIRVEKVPATLTGGLFVHANGGTDNIFVGAEADGFDQLQGVVHIDGAADNANLTYLDATGAVRRDYVLGFSDIGWDMRLGVVDGLPVVHSKFITKYTLEASQKDDTVRIDATSKSATDGTFINGNGGGDTITIGTAGSGLNSITGTVTVNGGPGLDVLIVDDQNGTAAGKYLVTDTKIQRIGGPSIENTDAIERTLKGAAGGNIIDITGNTDKLTVYAGPGSDEIHAGEVGGLGTILGAVNIDGEGGFDVLRVLADFLDPTLTAIERLEVQNGTFTVNTAALIFQQVEQTGGTLAGTANVTASESLVWLAGTMTGTGKMIADGSASISGGPVALTRELDLAGNSFWTANILGGTGKILNTGTLTTTSPQLEGELTNSGMLLPGGEWGVGYVNVTGNVSQTALGSLRIDITSTGYDQMIVNGPSNQVSLAGGLNVTLAPGYSPAVGTVFTIIQNNTSGLVLGNFFGLTNGSILVVGSTRFRINYGMPADSNNVTLTVVNEPPVANADFATTDEDTSVDIAVLANDTDPDNDALTIASVGVPFNGTATIVGSVIRYTPNANFNGTDTFTYVVADAYGNTASALVTITVNPINDAPIAVDDAATVTMLGGTVFVLANDSDVDGDELTIIAVGTASHGVASISGSTIFYVPNAGYSGTDTFTYTISDGHGLTATANVTVTV